MNSVANGKVRRVTPFRRVYVQSAAGDAGGAIGAAFALWHQLGGKRTFVMDHAYWGPEFRSADIAKVLSEAPFAECRMPDAKSRDVRTNRHSVSGPPLRSPMARSSVGFKDAWNGARARSAIAQSCAIPAELT